ncbi:hypothetical protein L1049_024787 [Liquidambar formosana]|uniref:Glutaredoxin domain-containing protein n=1 Tax=Liquidambar formosana TaxID=63359 RepID=A0AAP0WZZ1_LIQFO
MQQALPYKTWLPISTDIPRGRSSPLNHSEPTSIIAGGGLLKGKTSLNNLVSENAVIVFSKRGCCMSHVVKRLLLGLGVNPAVYEVDEDDELGVIDELERITGEGKDGGRLQFPAVFIGGKLFGGLERVMATHISGELVPVLKQAGALWL